MLKRLMIAMLGAVVLATAALPAAFAEEGRPPHGGGRGKLAGTVEAVGAESFDLQTRRGREVTVHVDENTAFQDLQGNELSLSDLQVGDKVGVKAERSGEQVVAVQVLILPDCPEGDRCFYQGVGTVDSVSGSTFEFTSRRGEHWTFEVDENTRFQSRDGSLDGIEDLSAGMTIFTAAWKDADGEWYSLVIRGPLVPKSNTVGPDERG